MASIDRNCDNGEIMALCVVIKIKELLLTSKSSQCVRVRAHVHACACVLCIHVYMCV